MSAGHAGRAKPQIAVGPRPADWAAEAIRSGGGEAVTLDDDPVGLVWTGGGVPEDLRKVLAAHPEIVWVQLPLAGVEALAEAGVIDRQRQWTSAKGAYAEPVAEHALALLLAGLRQLPMRARARSWGEPAAATGGRSQRRQAQIAASRQSASTTVPQASCSWWRYRVA